MFNVEIQTYEDLSDVEKESASDNGCGKEDANYLRLTHNGKTIFLESDAMEPEDVSFCRDLSWVKNAIIMAYNAGCIDKSSEIISASENVK